MSVQVLPFQSAVPPNTTSPLGNGAMQETPVPKPTPSALQELPSQRATFAALTPPMEVKDPETNKSPFVAAAVAQRVGQWLHLPSWASKTGSVPP